MKNKLDHIEARLRTLFEEQLLYLISGEDHHRNLVDDLIAVTRENLVESPEGVIYAPNRFSLSVPPKELSFWQPHQDILDEMAEIIQKLGFEEGFIFLQPPSICIQSDPEIAENEFIISAEMTKPNPSLPDTAAMTQSKSENDNLSLPEKACFVVDGKHELPLDKPVVNVGRHSDNDLILDDLHVSRHHAQLRSINQQFVIFDVGSSSGLFLNGKRITQATLQAGDVVRLGATNLIYVQESTGETPTTALPVDPDDQLPRGFGK